MAASPRILKVLAHRIGEDQDDVLLLARELGLTSADEVLAVAEAVFGDRLAAAAGFFVTHCSQRPTDVPPSDRRRTLGS